MQENTRYKVLAEKLLAHSAFHPFLEELSRDPALAETLSSVSNSASNSQQMLKDVNPYNGNQQFVPPNNNETHVGMTLIPEMPVDLSSLNIGSNNWGIPNSRGPMGQYMQPQIFAVTEVPEGPAEPIDFSALSGKDNDDVLSQFTEEEKSAYPEIDEVAPKLQATIEDQSSIDEAEEQQYEIDENDECMTLYAPFKSSKKTTESSTDEHDNIFGTIVSEKALAHFDLITVSEQDSQSFNDHFERMCARLEARCNRIEAMMF